MVGRGLTTVTRTQGNNQALKDGSVTPREFTLEFEEVPILVHAFRRMVRALEFDVCEMAFSTYLCARAHGVPFTALPIFLVRGFHHGAIVRAAASGITQPKELEGERVGVNRGYTVTTGVWARSILQDDYGVDLSKVAWVTSGDEHVAEYRPPANVIAMDSGGDLQKMLATGELAAVVGLQADGPDVRPLIADATEAGYRALQQRGFYPINHVIVVKDELLQTRPNVAPALFEAFAEAKLCYVERLRQGQLVDPSPTDLMYGRVMELTDSDPLPYGIAPNRAMIEHLIGHVVSQKILKSRPSVESLFPVNTHNLVA